MDFGSEGALMSNLLPYQIPFTRITITICHGVPAIILMSAALLFSLTAFEIASQSVKPVTLSAIWAVPNKVSSAQILAQGSGEGAIYLHKTGAWNRLCEVTAKQTFVDEHGGSKIEGELHSVDTPSRAGPFSNKDRFLQIPKLLANSPGIWKIQLTNQGVCNPIERFFPIGGMTAEATFEIVP